MAELTSYLSNGGDVNKQTYLVCTYILSYRLNDFLTTNYMLIEFNYLKIIAIIVVTMLLSLYLKYAFIFLV